MIGIQIQCHLKRNAIPYFIELDAFKKIVG